MNCSLLLSQFLLTLFIKRMSAVRAVNSDFSSASWNAYHLCAFRTQIIVILLVCQIVFEYFATSFYSGKKIQIECVLPVAFSIVF